MGRSWQRHPEELHAQGPHKDFSAFQGDMGQVVSRWGWASPARICRVRRSKRDRNSRTWTARIAHATSSSVQAVTPGRSEVALTAVSTAARATSPRFKVWHTSQPIPSPRASVIPGARNFSGTSEVDIASRDVGDDDREAAGALPDEALEATER